jgi:hypothetical protein
LWACRVADGSEVVSLAHRPCYSSERSYGIISDGSGVNSRAIVLLEEIGKLKKPITSLGFEPATFQLLA